MTAPLDEKAEHPRIWLEPAGAPDRCWCSDNQWGDEGVEYVLAACPSPSEMEDGPARNDDLVAASALYQCDECIAEEREFSCHQIEDVVIVNGKVVCKECVAEFYPKARTERAPDIAAKLRRQRMSVAQAQKRAAELSAQVLRLTEENEALRKERDEALALVNYAEDVGTTLVARIKALEEALNTNSREAAAGSAWEFIRPKLEKIAKEGGFAGTWSNGFRSGWDAAARSALKENAL